MSQHRFLCRPDKKLSLIITNHSLLSRALTIMYKITVCMLVNVFGRDHGEINATTTKESRKFNDQINKLVRNSKIIWNLKDLIPFLFPSTSHNFYYLQKTKCFGSHHNSTCIT